MVCDLCGKSLRKDNKLGVCTSNEICLKEGRRRSREKAVQFMEYIKTQPCYDCGLIYHSSLMEFDHVRGDKKFDISRGLSGTALETLIMELMKCELVCCMCHKVRTWNRSHPDDLITKEPYDVED